MKPPTNGGCLWIGTVSLVLLLGIMSTGATHRAEDWGQYPPADWQEGIAAGNLLTSPGDPLDARWQASIGNGYVATVVLSDTVYLGGVFNGNQSVQAPSHRARIPSTCAIDVGISGNSSSRFHVYAAALDLQDAVFVRRLINGDQSAAVEQRWYAHQVYRNVLVFEMDVIRLNQSSSGTFSSSSSSSFEEGDIVVPLTLNAGSASSDIAFQAVKTTSGQVAAQVGWTLLAEEEWVPLVQVAVVSTPVPSSVTLAAGQTSQTWRFLTTFATTIDSGNVLADALNDYELAWQGQRYLLEEHRQAWQTGLWSARIEVPGNLDLAQKVNSSLYYILSSLRADYAFGLSPGSLSSNAYNGHSFWDTETWMEPSMLLLHPPLARSLIEYRWRRRGAAAAFAQQLSPSYQGTAFPWETAAGGNNVCPVGVGTCTMEQHISGDIAFAMGQYFASTRDLAWLKSVGYPTLLGIAEFWASRAVFNSSTGQYDIDGVIPPDEYAVNVSNSVYTNVVAGISLNLTAQASAALGLQFPAEWLTIAQQLAIPFDPVRQIHLEYSGYTNETVKQADVILLGYPLLYPMSSQVRANDLNFYLGVTDPGGPAMTWAMFTIGYLELNQITLADNLFARSFLNIHPPYDIWAETASGSGAVNFITGAGGFLQGILNGYLGIRLGPFSESLQFCPRSAPNATGLVAHGLSYRGYQLRLGIEEQVITASILVAPVYAGAAACNLALRTEDNGQVWTFPASIPAAPLPSCRLVSVFCQ